MSWLTEQRRESQRQQWLMSQKFDLDGALATGQPELAARSCQHVLLMAVELYLCRIGIPYEVVLEDGRSDGALAVMAALRRADGRLADDVWDLVLLPAPESLADVEPQVRRVLDFVAERLGVSAQERSSAIRSWADSVDLLRTVAKRLGLAGSDDWYVHDGGPDDWYAQVMGVLETHL